MSTGVSSPNPNLITFFSAETADGNSTAYNVSFSEGFLEADGTWDGATVTFFQRVASGTYIPLNDSTGNVISWTSNASIGVNYIVWNQSIYATISNAGGSTSLNVTLQRTH